MRNAVFTFLVAGAMLLGTAPGAAAALKDDWAGSIFAGYNQTSGNTDKGAASLDGKMVKTWDGSSLTLAGKVFYSQSNNKMDGQKWESSIRYTQDYGEKDQWFKFYQIMADHDRFADIDSRIAPSLGIGYHFSRTEDWTWNADLGVGYQMTEYRSSGKSDDKSAILTGHTFMKKRVLENAFLSEDFTIIPSLESGAGFRVKSETAFTNPLSEVLDLEIKYLVDYNSEPGQDKSSTDKQIVVGVKYKF